MAEEFKSPWQIEHEKLLAQQEAERKSQAKAKRREFLRGLKITRKSDRTLQDISNHTEAEVLTETFQGGDIDSLRMLADGENYQTADAENISQTNLNPEYEDDGIIGNGQIKEVMSSIFASLKPFAPIFRKIWPPLFIFLLIFAGSVYALSPFNRIGSFKVIGNSIVSSSDIATSSDLTMQSSIYQIFMQRSAIEARITNSIPRIESTNLSISAPNKVTISIKEFPNIGYVEQKGKDYAILANGVIITETVIAANKLGANALVLKDFSDGQVKQFAQAYVSLQPSLQSLIRTVTLTPSQTTTDFITLQMSDGNQVKVPLSQMKQKLPYYPSIAKQVTAPTTVDMEIVEAGIFTSPTPQYNADFADDNPAGLSKSISASKATSGTSSSSSSSSSSTTSSSSQ